MTAGIVFASMVSKGKEPYLKIPLLLHVSSRSLLSVDIYPWTSLTSRSTRVLYPPGKEFSPAQKSTVTRPGHLGRRKVPGEEGPATLAHWDMCLVSPQDLAPAVIGVVSPPTYTSSTYSYSKEFLSRTSATWCFVEPVSTHWPRVKLPIDKATPAREEDMTATQVRGRHLDGI